MNTLTARFLEDKLTTGWQFHTNLITSLIYWSVSLLLQVKSTEQHPHNVITVTLNTRLEYWKHHILPQIPKMALLPMALVVGTIQSTDSSIVCQVASKRQMTSHTTRDTGTVLVCGSFCCNQHTQFHKLSMHETDVGKTLSQLVPINVHIQCATVLSFT